MSTINRHNPELVNQFLSDLRKSPKRQSQSIERYSVYLKHLLIWAGDQPLGKAYEIDLTLGQYLQTARRDGKTQPLSAETLEKVICLSQRFFHWLKSKYPQDSRQLTEEWISDLESYVSGTDNKEHNAVTEDEIQTIAKLEIPENNLTLRRNRAAACMLYSSGMRASAFVSLPLKAVNPERWSIRQWPELGVRTKNGKKATTYLLKIPGVLERVQEWDSFIRSELKSEETLWFTPITHQWGRQSLAAPHTDANRYSSLADGIRALYTYANLPYKNPHAFRHGYAVCGLKHASTIGDYKAVSQNMMHSDIIITDKIYAAFDQDTIEDRINGLTGWTDYRNLPPEQLVKYLQSLPRAQRTGIITQLVVALAA